MTYKLAERFKSIQGEGVYAGTPMAFIRFVGCSVGKKICQHCDTDFEKVGSDWRGGGEFSTEQLKQWLADYQHVCLTGGEPLDQDLVPLLEQLCVGGRMAHIETSGTVKPHPDVGISEEKVENLWVCVSPKPGFREDMIRMADEIKVIVPGLGTPESVETILAQTQTNGRSWHVRAYDSPSTFRWPTLEDALRWADMGKTVFLQPRNGKYDVDKQNLLYVQDVIAEHPQLRLSVQMHKILKVQ